MKKLQAIVLGCALTFSLISCNKEKTMQTEDPGKVKALKEKLAAYSPTLIKADLSKLTERQRKVVEKLVEASKLADEIFWKQSSADGIRLRDSLKKLNDPYSKDLLEYMKINYGAYDLIFDKIRFVGSGPNKKPEVANLYPQDMTKDEFENYIKAHPDQKDELMSQYTVVKRDGSKLYGEAYHKAYPEVEKIAKLLEEAAEFADDPALKNYLKLRAKAFRTDDYFESDMAWMDMTNSDIEVVIGPIENYIEEMFTYKTAWEGGVFIKDIAGTQELQVLKSHIDQLEKNLPYADANKKYIRKSAGGDGTILNIVNIVSFNGDFQKAVKTIATSLPNDPIVHEKKGAKKLMFKNMMEAKFDKIVKPIAEVLMDKSDLQYVDKQAFTSFVTLHEISHTLGRGFVFGNDKLSVREVMKDVSTTIEEAKADILSMYSHQYLIEIGVYQKDYMKKAMVTYLAGLFRSMRFGRGEAHGGSNYVQFNYLRENGAIDLVNGKYKINEAKFFTAVTDLSRLIITAQAEGNYDAAKQIIERYGKETPEIKQAIDKLSSIPRDLDTKYEM